MTELRPSSPPLLFEDLLIHLRRVGFSVGVDQYLRLQHLLPQICSECSPDHLKSILCPLFATNEKQQEVFYRAFDSFLPLISLETLKISAAETSAACRQVAPPQRRPGPARWPYFSVAFLLLVLLIGVATWKEFVASNAKSPSNSANISTPRATEITPSEPEPAPPVPYQIEIEHKLPARPLPEIGVLDRLVIRAMSLKGRVEDFTTRTEAQIEGIITRFPFDPTTVAALFGPILFLIAYEFHRSRQRRFVLHKEAGRRPRHSWPIRVAGRAVSVYNSPEFSISARRLHLRQVSNSYRFDADASIKATAGALGFPLLRYRPDTHASEYLVLIDRASAHDHQAALFAELVTALREHGLYVEEYFFDEDPRICWSAGARTPVPLSELQSKYGEHRLLLLGDADSLTDPVTGRQVPWAGAFSAWVDRAILTPVLVSQWGTRERALAGQFVVLPATTEALLSLMEFFGGSEANEVRDGTARSNGEIRESVSTEELVNGLKLDLGPELFPWLCACAVYPELHWDLTLQLASLRHMPGELVTEANLLRLIGIPWYRSGFIPDEVRWELIQQLDIEQEREVRQAIIDLLEQNPAGEGTIASDRRALEIAINRYRISQTARQRRAARQLLKDFSLNDGDYVALRSLESVKASPLDFLLPKLLRRIVYQDGLPVRGLRTMSRLSAALVLTVIGLSGISRWRNVQFEKQVLAASEDVAADVAHNVPAPVPSLDALRRLEALRQKLVVLGAYNRDGAPWSLRFGWYTGNDIYPDARSAYFKRFYQLMLYQTQASLLFTLQALPPKPGPAFSPAYRTLKAYLITTVNPGKSTQLFLVPILIDCWTEGRTIDSESISLAQRQFDFYAEELKTTNPYPWLAETDPRRAIAYAERSGLRSVNLYDRLAVEGARKYLNQFRGADSVYQFMLAEAEKASHPISFNQMFPAAAQTVVDRTVIPGTFTKDGWVFMRDALKDPSRFIGGERWVLGQQGMKSLDMAAVAQLRERYQADYTRQWREFLKNAVVLRYSSPQDANLKLKQLAAAQSPLLQLFSLAADNTEVMLRSPILALTRDMLDSFQAVNEAGPNGILTEEYITALRGLQNALDPLATQSRLANDDDVARIASQQTAAKRTVGLLAVQFGKDPEAATVRRLLEAPISNVDPLLQRIIAETDVGSLLILLPGLSELRPQQVILEIDGDVTPIKGSNNQIHLTLLAAKQHIVRVHAVGGFQEEPPQTVNIKKGEEARLEFHLHPNPTVSVLAISGAAAGAQVTLDQRPAGSLQADGMLSVPNIPPGSHIIEITGYRPITKTFKAGEIVTLTQPDLVPLANKAYVAPQGEPPDRKTVDGTQPQTSSYKTNASSRSTAAEEANQRGIDLFKAGLYSEALVNFNETIRLAPENAIAYYNRGRTMQLLGRYEEAITDYDKTIALNPGFTQAVESRKVTQALLAAGIYNVGNGVSTPIITHKVEPEYTREARQARIQGTVLLHLVVDEQGRARDVRVVESLGHGLDEKAIAAVLRWKFKPGVKDGKPVSVQVKIPVQFRLP